MGVLDKARSSWIEMRCQWRMFKHVGRFMPGKPFSAARLLDERVAADPNGLALLYLDERYTFRELDEHANQYANFFRSHGIGKGDVVALMLDNRPDFLLSVLGLNKLRAVSALINTNISGAGLTHAINVAQPKAVLVGSEHVESVSEVRAALVGVEGRVFCHVDHDGGALPAGFERINESLSATSKLAPRGVGEPDTAERMCYIYTSGTTGLPKAAIIANKRWLAAAYLFGGAIMNAQPRDVIYVPLPFYHSSAMFAGLGGALVGGAAIAMRRKFSASQFWDDVRKFDASIFLYIGELCRYLLNTEKSPHERNHRLRLGVGNGLRPDIWLSFQQRFGVPLIREFYGATEGNAPIVNFEGRPGMVGRLKPGQVLVRCDEATGEIVRNAQGRCDKVSVGDKGILLGRINRLFSFDGYVDKAATQKKVIEDVFEAGDRYFNSGDLLHLHPDGWVSFADRVGDTFRWKGENVSTNEVAEVLNAAEGVLESNVYGVHVTGAEGRAGMASVNVDGELDLERFSKHVCTKLPAYQRPYFLRVQSGMRITGTFKHQKVDYRDEGYDPAKVKDPLYFLDGDRYIPIDEPLYKRLAAGEIGPR
jgi:acyl-CoA synthetase (AMP-forming)/AMP-acid ligase II